MPSRTRLLLLSQLAAVAAVAALALLAAGLPLLARRALGPLELVGLALLVAAVVALLGGAILFRWVGRPLDRVLAAAARLGAAGQLPPLGPPGEEGGPSLARAALAFERTSAALAEERVRLAAKVAELEAVNARLAEAREGLLRTERLATVGQLAAGIAHEVGNPLGAIGGFAELARAKLAAGDAAVADDFLERIGVEVVRIDAIVRGLLDFARPPPTAPGPVALAEAVEAAARLARVQARFRQVELQVDLPAGLPPVRAEARRLAQVVLNLLLNAADAVGGSGLVRVTGREAGGEVWLEVEDSGPGIPDEALPRIFDPFFTTKEPGQGTGLGLAVCHGIMASFGGAIEAGRGEAGGARLRLRLRPAAPVGAR